MRYEIRGESLPVVICELESGEQMITEGGAMSWMSPNMHMDTSSRGGAGKVFGRMFAGESLFQNIYTCRSGRGTIAFASSFPGSIRAFNIAPGRDIIVQKRAFLASTAGVELSVTFQKRFGAGLFGGEGFIMQRLSGEGTAFVEIDGHAVEYDLAAGQSIVLDTGYLAAMSASCTIDIQPVQGVKNIFLGGEGLFNTLVTGPGHIILQTMPLSKLANGISANIPTAGK